MFTRSQTTYLLHYTSLYRSCGKLRVQVLVDRETGTQAADRNENLYLYLTSQGDLNDSLFSGLLS